IVTPTRGDIRAFPCVGDDFLVGVERVVRVIVALLAVVFDAPAVGDGSRAGCFALARCGGLVALAVLVGRLVAFGIVARDQALAGGAFACKGLLVVGSVGKERALFAAAGARDRGPVVDAETAGFGLGYPRVALAVVHPRAEGFERGFDALL